MRLIEPMNACRPCSLTYADLTYASLTHGSLRGFCIGGGFSFMRSGFSLLYVCRVSRLFPVVLLFRSFPLLLYVRRLALAPCFLPYVFGKIAFCVCLGFPCVSYRVGGLVCPRLWGRQGFFGGFLVPFPSRDNSRPTCGQVSRFLTLGISLTNQGVMIPCGTM